MSNTEKIPIFLKFLFVWIHKSVSGFVIFSCNEKRKKTNLKTNKQKQRLMLLRLTYFCRLSRKKHQIKYVISTIKKSIIHDLNLLVSGIDLIILDMESVIWACSQS